MRSITRESAEKLQSQGGVQTDFDTWQANETTQVLASVRLMELGETKGALALDSAAELFFEGQKMVQKLGDGDCDKALDVLLRHQVNEAK